MPSGDTGTAEATGGHGEPHGTRRFPTAARRFMRRATRRFVRRSTRRATRRATRRGGLAYCAWAVSLAMLAFLPPRAAHEARAAETACPPVAPRHVELPATRAAFSAKRAIAIVAFGSSSTEGAGASAPDRTYPARLAAILRARWPGADMTLLNRGAGGQTVEAMLARLDRDVLAVRPALVIWQVGANDALRGLDPARFGALLDEGVQRITATGGDLVLMDNQIAPRLPVTERLALYGGILAHAAALRSVSLFSRTALMQEWRAAAGEETMIGRDGLHHTDLGYACLAESLAAAIASSVERKADGPTSSSAHVELPGLKRK